MPPTLDSLRLAGACHVLYAYEVAHSIDLDRAEQRLTTLAQRETIKHKRHAPRYFEYRPLPLRVRHAAPVVAAGPFQTEPHVDAVLYDFGAVSISFTVPFNGTFADLTQLAVALNEHPALLAESLRRVEASVATLADTMVRPRIADVVESYALFHVTAISPNVSADDLCTTYAQPLAQVLRSEQSILSTQEVQDALAYHISFRPTDVTITDWDAALVHDPDADDVLAVLEFANVELLEMRYLDQQLDDALDQAYPALSRGGWSRSLVPGSMRADLHRVGQLQLDAALLFENVNNALKLLGDQYLARVYRLVSQRFHLTEWDGSILRKLQTLESIYDKMSDQASSHRLELLEWIIIVLIAVSIVLPFVPGLSVAH